ncbi:DUF6042 family protein [Paenibacillus chondroitinus]|uniref:DUF6042 family protein n=1 Tax=Paenibacillus chondroitinus TaxID=59842 RepID=A0ABU6DKV0_9BACL|nr:MULTISPECIES: DUF6042 family protein [Paenibacillus]MCY9657118.1 DUF6042 family protein [Paenibacillus anseongense]MEB4798401.1 DUF6042 family protein [Paenibacillus chondroitinus]
MNLGKITVRLLSMLNLIPEGQYILPKNFYEYGWAGWLPLVNLTSLPKISYCVASDFTKQQTIEYLIHQKVNHTLWDFDLIRNDFATKKEEGQYQLFYARELNIRNRLEKNGLSYPSTMSEAIQLFIDLGLVTEFEDMDQIIKLDLIIRPFPQASSVLKNL